MKEIINVLLGGHSAPEFFGLVFFSVLGVILMLLLHTTARDINSKRTPVTFSWKFLAIDNLERLLAGIIMIYIAIRFTPDVFGFEINHFTAFLIGCINDQIANAIKNKAKAFISKIQPE